MIVDETKPQEVKNKVLLITTDGCRACEIMIKLIQEAIAGYKNALDILKDKMTSEQNDEKYKVLNHIILEEKEHIEELKKLKSDLE